MSNFKNRVGETIGNFTIMQELGKGKVAARCNTCGKEYEYNKSALVTCKLSCKNTYCVKAKKSELQNKIGQIINNLEIIEELGKGKVLASCLDCGTRGIYNKHALIHGVCACKNIKCVNHSSKRNIINVEGKEFNGLRVTKELGKNKVLAYCNDCKKTKEYDKRNLIAGKSKCSNCKARYRDRIGEVYNNLQVVSREGSNVTAKCIQCGQLDNYNSRALVVNRAWCKKCGLYAHYKNKVINNVTVLDFAYTGRNNKKYYKCKCNTCKEELLLTHEEIIAYKCNKE